MTGYLSVLLIAVGSIALWIGITFINGTLFAGKFSTAYEVIKSPLWRMILILPVMGTGHLLFSLALKINPVFASPAGIIFTVIPPALYALWLINSFPNTKVTVYIAILVFFAVLLGFELNKLS